MLEPQNPQNKHFVREMNIASESTFSYEFSHVPQNGCFTRGFRQFFNTSTLDAALTQRFTKHVTRHVWSAVPATQNDDGCLQSAAPATKKCNWSSDNDAKLLQLWNLKCHTAPGLPRETRLRDLWYLQKWPLLQNSPAARPCCPHDGRSRTLVRTLANGCERLRTVADTCRRKSSVERTRLNPQTPKVKREPCATHSGKIYYTIYIDVANIKWYLALF